MEDELKAMLKKVENLSSKGKKVAYYVNNLQTKQKHFNEHLRKAKPIGSAMRGVQYLDGGETKVTTTEQLVAL